VLNTPNIVILQNLGGTTSTRKGNHIVLYNTVVAATKQFWSVSTWHDCFFGMFPPTENKSLWTRGNGK